MIFNEHYYRALNVVDRIEEVRESKGICKTEFGKQLNFTRAYYYSFYNPCRTLRVIRLQKVAKVLNVSVDYLLTGKKLKEYKDFQYNTDKIINCDRLKLSNRLKVIRRKLETGVIRNITVKTLFEFEHDLNIPAIKLIGG